MNRQAAPPTMREYMQRPEESGVQLIDGWLVMEPTPNLFHQEIVNNVAFLLTNHVRRWRLGKVYPSPVGVYLSERDALQPDVMFVSNDNFGILQPDGAHAYRTWWSRCCRLRPDGSIPARNATSTHVTARRSCGSWIPSDWRSGDSIFRGIA